MQCLDNLLIKIINKGSFQYNWSFHTLTFNITEHFNKEDLQKGIKIYLSWLKIIYIDIKINKHYYIYVYEISENHHIHIHLLSNKVVNDEDKEYLIKKWNDYNDWKFYNKKGLVIKNNNEYDDFINLNDSFINIEKKAELALSRYTHILNIFKYMFKSINDFEAVLKLYYMIYPIKIVGGLYDIKFIEYIEDLNKEFLKTIYDYLNVYNPFLSEKEDEMLSLKYVYMKWKHHVHAEYPYLIELFEKIQNEENKFKKQEIIEKYLLQKKDIINECKLYCMKKDDFELLQKNLLLSIEKKMLQNDHFLIFFLEKKENTIYYILETLIKVIRFYKEEVGEKLTDPWDLEKNFYYTESYFKFIMQNLYQTQIISVNLKNQSNLYINKDEEFLNNLQLLLVKDPDFYSDFIYYYDNLNIKNNYKELYIKNQFKIETKIGIFIDDILNILYELNIIKKDDLTQLIYDGEKNQIYFTLTDKFLNYLVLQSAVNEIIPPLLIKPDNYELENDTKLVKGGYQQLSNMLFSKNENLKYKLSVDIIDLINKAQEGPLFINKKYFNYLLKSNVKKIEEITDLDITNFEKIYLDEHISKKTYRKVPQALWLEDFFLTLYIIEIFQNDDLWFISKLDERGRKYDVGYPLNFYRDKILRNVFLLNKQQIIDSINESIILRYNNYKVYYNYIKIILNKEKNYNIFNILQNPIECIVGFDAKNQIYQILGGLLKNKKLLQLSHIIDLDTEYSKNDVYDYFLKKLWKNLYQDKAFDIFISNLNKIIFMSKKNEIKILKKLEKMHLNELSIGSLSIWFDRDWIKQILMTYGYNKGLPGLISYTYNTMFYNTLLLDASNKMCNKLCTIIVTKLIKLFNEEIDSLKYLKLLFNGLISLSYYIKEPIFISLNNNNGFYQYYTELEKFSFLKWKKDGLTEKKKVKWKRIRISYIKLDENKKNIQLKKGMNAIIPNMCHYIDSLLMYNILNKILQDKISVKTIHDSFYLNIRYKQYIYDLYYEEYIKIFQGNTLAQVVLNALKYFKKNAIFNNFIVKFNINFEDLIFKHEFSVKRRGLNDDEKIIYNFLLKIKNNYKLILKSENYLEVENLRDFILNNKHNKIII